MADTGIYFTTAQVAKKAGSHANATAVAEGYCNLYAVLVEGIIHTMCRKVFATNTAGFTAMPAGGKYMLSEAAACRAAIMAIEYDMSGFPSLEMATAKVDILWAEFNQAMKFLMDKDFQKFIIDGV